MCCCCSPTRRAPVSLPRCSPEAAESRSASRTPRSPARTTSASSTGRLQRIWRRIAERKRAEAPTLLPFLLVTTPQDVSLFARFLWTAVDELIQAPVQTLEGPADASTLAGWDPAPVYGTSKGYRDQGASEIGGVFTPRSMYTALRPHAVQ
jgi:hypothetical protein